jgi:hypothetical protein
VPDLQSRQCHGALPRRLWGNETARLRESPPVFGCRDIKASSQVFLHAF